MNLDELEADERIALVGLVLAMVDADTTKTDEEMAEFRAIAADVGRREFDEAFRVAKAKFHSFDEAMAFAKASVKRADAREIIYTVLVDLAAADFVAPEEQQLIDAVAAGFGIRTARDSA